MADPPSIPPSDYIQPDDHDSSNEFLTDTDESMWDADSIRSTLNSSARFRAKWSNGMLYPVYGEDEGEYMMPIDNKFLDRYDLTHMKYRVLLDKKSFLAPISSNPQAVLDLGCGTGIWAIEFADQHPSAEVIGVDLAPTQPPWLPNNCNFEIDDFENDWRWNEDKFDFIFMRDPFMAVRDFPRLIDQIYTHLKPGGWVEFQTEVVRPACDDSSVPRDSVMFEFGRRVREASEKMGRPVDTADKWQGWFEERGFENITGTVIKMPMSPWPKDERLKLVGAYEWWNINDHMGDLAAPLFKKSLGWPEDEANDLVHRFQQEVLDHRKHCYWPFNIMYARKPLQGPSAS